MGEFNIANGGSTQPTNPNVGSLIDAAAKALTSADAQPDRVKVFHNGDVYLDIPMSKGRLICPINVVDGLLEIEIWGKHPEKKDKCILSSRSIHIKESVR